ncbi:GntR family transcriptional regulator [Rothia sp. AR01]|uniref:GntR family transcriptional regulator n=1 Tax=Rothia santali TaxID=2949643 RepID=A0A9X2HC78_9MICC|nr:GntR family transcriptional regulator [Rothia santali]MCP3426974.1 GntR family transcriptional regulator [Rothia santali]
MTSLDHLPHLQTGPALLDALRRKVLSDDVELGVPLSEAQLAQEFDVSRTPIREALRQLQAEGLVEIRSKVGTFIREPDHREMAELFQIKGSLEGLAAGLLAQRGPVAELDALRANIEDSERAAAAGDAELYSRLVHEFHWTIVQGADNRKLVEHYSRLMNQLAYHRLVRTSLKQKGRIRASTGEHERVLERILDKDAARAEMIMRQHVAASASSTIHELAMQAESGS